MITILLTFVYYKAEAYNVVAFGVIQLQLIKNKRPLQYGRDLKKN